MTRLREPGLIGVAVDPNWSRGEQALALAQLADDHHADLVTVNDEPYIPEHLEAWTLLATLAARTEHIAVTPNVAALALRPPAMLAKAAASLQVLSGGRVVLGLGAGGPLDDIAAFGGARRTVGESVAALEEAIGLIRRLWTPGQDPTPHSGRFYQHGGLPFGPAPPQPVPIWTGAFGPRMLTLTGQLTDGWLPTNYFLDLADVPAMQQRIDTAATQAGRDPSQIRRVFNVMGAITDTGPTENGRSLIGPPGFWLDALHDYQRRLGFDSFVFWPTQGDRLAQTRRFLQEVRPNLPQSFQPPARRNDPEKGGDVATPQ